MQNLTRRALRVYAVLEEYGEGSSDPLDALLPFFEPILSEFDGEIFDSVKFAECVKEQYHWNFTSDIAEELCASFLSKGWLEKVAHNGSHVSFLVKLPNTSDNSNIASTVLERKLLEIADTFKSFVEELSPLTTVNLSVEKFADILVEWLVSIDAYSEEVLNYTVHAGKKGSDGTLAININIPDTCSLSDDEKFITARFVKKLLDEDSPYSTDLCRIASVGLLTEVVQDFHKPTSAVKKTDLCIYLDAPVTMELLDVSGKAANQNISMIIEEFIHIGGTLRICRLTLDEISGALNAVLKRPVPERTGPTADAIRRREVLERYVRDVASSPEVFLAEKYNVKVDERRLDEYPNLHQYFTAEHHDSLFSGMGFHLDPHRKEHDAHVLTSVVRRRAGFTSYDLFSSRFIFLTRNGTLAQFSKRFCNDIGLYSNKVVSPAIHQRELATAIWLRTGLSNQSNEIPKRYTLAACEKVLEVKKGLVEQVRKAALNLSEDQARQLDMLLGHDRSVQHLQDKFLGKFNVVSVSNPELFIETLKEGLIIEEKTENKKEIQNIHKKSALKIKAEEEARMKLELELSEVNTQLMKVEKEQLLRVVTVQEKAHKVEVFCRKTLKTVMVLFIIILAVYLFFSEKIENEYVKSILWGFVTILSIALAAHQLLSLKIGIGYLSRKVGKWYFDRQVEAQNLLPIIKKHSFLYQPKIKEKQ